MIRTTELIVDDSFDEALERAARAAATALDAVGAAVVVGDGLFDHYIAHAGVDPGLEISRALARDIGTSRLVMAADAPLAIVDTAIDARVRPEVSEVLGIRAIAGVPLRIDGNVVGALLCFDRRPRSLDPGLWPASLIAGVEQRLAQRRRRLSDEQAAWATAVVAGRPLMRLTQAVQAGAVPAETFLRALRLLPPISIPVL